MVNSRIPPDFLGEMLPSPVSPPSSAGIFPFFGLQQLHRRSPQLRHGPTLPGVPLEDAGVTPTHLTNKWWIHHEKWWI